MKPTPLNIPLRVALLIFMVFFLRQSWGQPPGMDQRVREKQLEDARERILDLENKIRELELNTVEDKERIDQLKNELSRCRIELHNSQNEGQPRGESSDLTRLVEKCDKLEQALEEANKEIERLKKELRAHPR